MEAAMRLAGRERLGFYPLPAREAERIRRFLVFPDKPCCALDPCVGEGAAFAEIASDKNVLRYAVRLRHRRTEIAAHGEALLGACAPVAYTRGHPGVRCSCQANYRLCCAACKGLPRRACVSAHGN